MAKRANKRRLRPLAAPFTVAAPSGARIRDRLRVTAEDAQVLRLLGEHLGSHQRRDLARRITIGNVPARDNQRAERKRALTAVSSSRWAGAITRASEDQYQLAMRTLQAHRVSLQRAIRVINQRLAAACGQRHGRVRGYATRDERRHKQRRLQTLRARLTSVEQQIASARPAIVAGGRRLLNTRHNLHDAHLTEAQWRERWQAQRLFLTADGESGAPHGNYTITVHPDTGQISIVLPAPLRHLANAPRGRYTLSCTVTFSHRRQEWLDRASANKAVRYDIACDPERGRWYLDASWAADTTVLPTPQELRASGVRVLGVDLNAGHLAACVLDGYGNPVGEPFTIPAELTGPSSQRDGRLRAAITQLIRLARTHGCAAIAVEDLGFDDARATGRETLGRGKRGKALRRTVAQIPTAKFRERIRGMAYHAGLVLLAVDPAYTSRWGGRYWTAPLQDQTKQITVTRHHGAAVAIARRGLGQRVRRRPGVTARHQRMAARRATGQAIPAPRARGAASPPRTAGTPHGGGKTRPRRSDPFALSPAPHDRSEGHRLSPVSRDPASNGQHR